MWTFKIPEIPSYRDVSVAIYDDDSTSDHIWQSILSTRWAVNIGFATLLLEGIAINAPASGSIQLANKSVTVDSSELICEYSIKTPWYFAGKEWETEGFLLDSSGSSVGQIRFMELRNANTSWTAELLTGGTLFVLAAFLFGRSQVQKVKVVTKET